MSDRDFAADFLYSLAMIGIHLSRFSEDLIIWSTTEFRFIEFSDVFATGSASPKNIECQIARWRQLI